MTLKAIRTVCDVDQTCMTWRPWIQSLEKLFQIPSVRLSTRSLFLSIDSNTEGLVLLFHNIYLENTRPVVFLLHLLDILEFPA